MKLLPGILLLFVLLASGCQTISGTPALTTEETEQAQSFLDLDSDMLDMDALLPMDPSIHKATLDNGLTYYIRHNTEPANRATMMLVVNAGSVQEDDDQLGLAHFLEHMLFNGTERFPKHELIDFFESVGMSFGADVNASTSYDETIYSLEFPTDDEEIIGVAFQVMEDWASRATISDEEVDNERGIILEEERLRWQNANGRLNKQRLPFLLGDSRYTDRNPMGDLDIIRNAPADALRRFYRDWYRPDLMAVIVVGDIDVDAMEAKIIEHFSELPAPETPRPRLTYSVPDHADPRYLIFTDPELPLTWVQINFRQAAEELGTAAAYRNKIIGSLFHAMLNHRLNDISKEADAPFLGASVDEGYPLPVRGVTSQNVFVLARQGEEALSSLDAALTEIERVRRHGFTAAELERAKSELLNSYERLFNDQDNRSSYSLAREYSRRNFLQNEPVTGAAFEYRLVERLLPAITRGEVNREADQYVGSGNRSVLAVSPGSLPNQEELAVVIEAVQAKQIDPYQDIEAVTALLADVPQPADIISRQTDESYNITDLTLANGVRVLLKPTTFKKEEVRFSAISPGGTSLVTDEDYMDAELSVQVVSLSGVSDVSYPALQRLLAEQAVEVSPFIRELNEGFDGHAGQDSVETIFQLVYLYGTAPHADGGAFDMLKDTLTVIIANSHLNPQLALLEAISEARYGKWIREATPTLERIESLDLERGFSIYQERFADFSDFTFFFAGNFDVEQMVDWSQIYLGNLPSLNRNETWRDVSPDPPAGIVEASVYRGQEKHSATKFLFTGPGEDTLENRLRLRMLETILGMLMLEELREERGGVYSPKALGARMVPDPDGLYEISFSFDSDPGRVEELVDALLALITGVQNDGPRDDLLEAAQAQYVRQREDQLEQNSYWLNVLKLYATEEDVDLASLVDLEVVKSRVEAVTAEDIQAAAQEFLPVDRYILVTLYPEDFEQ